MLFCAFLFNPSAQNPLSLLRETTLKANGNPIFRVGGLFKGATGCRNYNLEYTLEYQYVTRKAPIFLLAPFLSPPQRPKSLIWKAGRFLLEGNGHSAEGLKKGKIYLQDLYVRGVGEHYLVLGAQNPDPNPASKRQVCQ